MKKVLKNFHRRFDNCLTLNLIILMNIDATEMKHMSSCS